MINRILLLARLETRLFMREPAAVFFAFAFPFLMLIFFGTRNGGSVVGGIRFIDAYFPLLVGVSAANLGVMGLSLHLAENRARGVLRRFRLSPLGPLEFFAAHVVTTALVMGLALSALGGYTVAMFGPAPHFRPLVFGVGVLVTMYAMFSLGVFVGGLPVSARSNQVIGAVLFFLMFFGSGALVRPDQFPSWLAWVRDVNPLSYLIELLAAGYIGQSGIPVLPLVVLCVGTVLLNLLTSKTFDWEGKS